MTAGRVTLIGGGPGAADLLTVRGARAIAAADVVIWGRWFVSEDAVREHARPGAEIVAWPPATMADLHAVYDRARDEGLHVARLYSGDPALFSRLGEELEAVRARGLAVEVVPGVTAMSAAAAALCIELTGDPDWRPLVVAGKEGIDGVASRGDPMAIYMASGRGAELQAQLLDAGFAPATRCAVAQRVTWADEVLTTCTLSELAARIEELEGDRLTLVLVAPALGA